MNGLNSNEKLLIQLEQQLKNTNENQNNIINLTKEIFAKIDNHSKEIFSIGSKADTLRETNEIKFADLKNQLTEYEKSSRQKLEEYGKLVTQTVTTLEEKLKDTETLAKDATNDLETFRKDEFKPVSDDVQKAKGALVLIKYVYPILTVALQVIAVLVAVYLGAK